MLFLRNSLFSRNRLLRKSTKADASLFSSKGSNGVLESVGLRRDRACSLQKCSQRPFSMYTRLCRVLVCKTFFFKSCFCRVRRGTIQKYIWYCTVLMVGIVVLSIAKCCVLSREVEIGKPKIYEN